MTIDSSEYLVRQGWEGKGKALKKGGRAKPISIVQKKTMAGVGKVNALLLHTSKVQALCASIKFEGHLQRF